jgi:predicted HicB family RNase H-like nuclease
MSTMLCKGYFARFEYSVEDKCFVGHIDGIRDIVGFHADTEEELRIAFEEAVDDYLRLRAWEAFDRVMAKVKDRPPLPGDEL